METVRYEQTNLGTYEVTRRPIMVRTYKHGCLVEEHQKIRTVYGKCGSVDYPQFHDTWRRC